MFALCACISRWFRDANGRFGCRTIMIARAMLGIAQNGQMTVFNAHRKL